jgi:hypothetical protein
MKKCTNRLGTEYNEDRGPCGDEGRLCEECMKREEAYWLAYFGGPERISAQNASDRFYREHASELDEAGRVK